jgi:hypothetical protein
MAKPHLKIARFGCQQASDCIHPILTELKNCGGMTLDCLGIYLGWAVSNYSLITQIL